MKTRTSTFRLIAAALLSSAAVTLLFAASGVLTPEREDLEEDESRPDQPDEALRFRRLQLQDENKKIPAGGLQEAMRHMAVMKAAQAERARVAGKTMGMEVADIQPGNWSWLGPGNIGGRIRSIIIDPNNANNMWVGSVGGGIWRSTDAGVLWQPVTGFAANLAVSSIIISPTNPNIMYAGTGEGFGNFDALQGGGVFQSTDTGVTWNLLASTNPATAPPPPGCGVGAAPCPVFWSFVNRLAISPDGSTILAATVCDTNNDGSIDSGGLQQSTDGGATWIQRTNTQAMDVVFRPGDSTQALVGELGAARYSTTSGQNWTAATFSPAISNGGTSLTNGRVELAYASNGNPQTVYAAVNNNNGDFYQSTDGGRIYTRVNTGTNFLGAQGWYDNTVWVNPQDATFVVVGGIDLWRSTDSGTNFTQISRWQCGPGQTTACAGTSAHADQHMIVAHPAFDNSSNKKVYFSNDGGLFRADDVSTVSQQSGWTNLNHNLGITQFFGAAVSAGSVIFGGAQDNGTIRVDPNFAFTPPSYDPQGWVTPTNAGGDGGYVAVDPVDGNYLYGEKPNLQIFRSTDGGITVGSIFTGITDTACTPPPGGTCLPPANFVAPFMVDPNEPNRILAGGTSLWRSSDVKAATPTWLAIKPPVSDGLIPPSNVPISAITVSPNNPDFIVVGHNGGQIYLTFDGTGTNPPLTQQCPAGFSPCWNRIDNGTPARLVTRLVMDETRSPNWIYATFGGFSNNNVYVTKDLGLTWIDVSGATGSPTDLPSVPVRSLVINPVHSDFLYAGSEVGIFASEDGGATWNLPQDGPANVSVDDLFWLNGDLAAVTHGRGMYKTSEPVYSTSYCASPPNCDCFGNWYCGCSWNIGRIPNETDDIGLYCPMRINGPYGGVARNVRIDNRLTIFNGYGLHSTGDLANFGTITHPVGEPYVGIDVARDFYNSGAGIVELENLTIGRDLTNGGIIALSNRLTLGRNLSMSANSTLTAAFADVSGDCANGGVIQLVYDLTCKDISMTPNSMLTARIVSVRGNVANSGTMVGQGVGQGITLSPAPHTFSGTGTWSFTNLVIPSGATVSLGSNVTLAITNVYNNGMLDVGNWTLNYTGSYFANNLPVLGTGTLRFAPATGNAQFLGNGPSVRIASGSVEYPSGGTIGTFTIDNGATFSMNTPGSLTVNGDVTVNGALSQTGYTPSLIFNGAAFTNNGSVGSLFFLTFNNTGTPKSQTISGTGSWTPQNIQIGDSASPTTVTLQNDVTFASKQLITGPGSLLDVGPHVLTLSGQTNAFYGRIAGTGLVKVQPSGGTPTLGGTSGSTFLVLDPSLEIVSGTVRATGTTVGGSLTIDPGATLSLLGFLGMTANGNVTNNGTLNALSDNPSFNFNGGTFTNNGPVTGNVYVSFGSYFGPPLLQNLAGTGSWAGSPRLFIGSLSTTTLLNDLTYNGGNLWVEGRLDTGAFTLSLPCNVISNGAGNITGNIRRTNLAACPGAAFVFGNSFTTIQFTSGIPPTEVTVNVQLASPAGFPSAVARTYTINAVGGSGWTATLRLHYEDSELNGNNESTLQLYRNDGTNWNVQGATNRNTTNNWVEYSGVTQFSPWTLSSSTPTCTFSLDHASQNFNLDGGDGSVNVTSPSGCFWSAVNSSPGFITITSGDFGFGNGTVNFTVSPNVGPARAGQITISGQIFTITQDPGCTFSISPTGHTFSSAGGSDNIAVTSACDWTATSNDGWITITSGATGTGDGTIAYSVAANAAAPRLGTITVAPALGSPRTFSVGQGSITPSCSTPPTGMVSWWPGAGDANDIEGTNHGTLENGVTFAPGQVGQAFSFDGVDDSVLMPSINIGSSFTVEFWIYPTAAVGDYQHLVSNQWTSPNYGALYFYDDHLEYYQNISFRLETAPGSVPLNAWAHVALTYDNSVDRLYLNGNLVATSINHAETFNNQVRLGFTLSPDSSNFQGLLDEVTLFGRALTIAEVQGIYLASGAGKCQDATPTPTPTPTPITLSGTISYCSNPVPGPVPNVTLHLTGDTTASTLSDSSGNYQFASLVAGLSYIVTPTKAARSPASAGINTIDAIAVQRHFLALGIPLSGCKLTAADVNGDTRADTIDAIGIQRFFLGYQTAIANVGKYLFSPASRAYPGIVGNQTAQDYDTLVFGDVASSFAERLEGASQDAAGEHAGRR